MKWYTNVSRHVLTPSLWLPILQPWQQRWVPQSSESSWHRTPWWSLRPSGAKQQYRSSRLSFFLNGAFQLRNKKLFDGVKTRLLVLQSKLEQRDSPSHPLQSPSASLSTRWSACGWPTDQREMTKTHVFIRCSLKIDVWVCDYIWNLQYLHQVCAAVEDSVKQNTHSVV